jgi:hypothetical protein
METAYVSFSNQTTHEMESDQLSDTEDIEDIEEWRHTFRILMLATESLYDSFNIDVISKEIKNKIIKIIFNSIEQNTTFLDMNLCQFHAAIIKRCEFFGFKQEQSYELFVFYANNIDLMTTVDFTLEELLVFDYYGYFSDEIHYHIKLLQNTSDIYILHNNNNYYYYTTTIKKHLKEYYHNQYILDMLIVFIMWVNDNENIIISNLNQFISNVINNDKIKHLTMQNNKRDLVYMLEDLSLTISFESVNLY